MTDHLEGLKPSRQKAVQKATDGCWDGTEAMVAAMVRDGMGKASWAPARGLMLNYATDQGEVQMTPAQFGIWKRQARYLAKAMKRTQEPREDLGSMSPWKYQNASGAKRSEKDSLRISKAEAMACAHYLAGFEKPCTPTELRDWFWGRFNSISRAAEALGMDDRTLAAQVNGYRIVDGEREEVEAPGSLLRALDWLLKVGPVHPYGVKAAVSYFPGQDPVER